jgi:hypothetical protein
MVIEKQNNKSGRFDIKNLTNNGWFILCCNICSIIGLIITIVSNNKTCQIIFTVITSLTIFSMLFYLFYRVFSLKRARRNIHKTYLATNIESFSRLHVFYQELLSYINMIRTSDSVTKNTFHDKATLLCNRIEKIFTVYLGTKNAVSVCIKFIKADTILNNDFLNSEVYTFARSNSTSPTRLLYDQSDNQPDRIIDNSDFEMIVSSEKIFKNIDHFACEDLDSYPDKYLKEFKKEFKNSHSAPPYKSAIIIPIRAKIENTSNSLKKPCIKTKCFHIVGFLCIDSEEKFLTSEDYRRTRFLSSTELAYTIGESLYPFFEEYLTSSL